MKNRVVLASLALFVPAALAEVHTLTLRQAAERALRSNPDALIAKLDERRAAEQTREARDPFYPKAFVGSGLAYSSGFPMSIEGSAPTIVQGRAIGSLYNQRLRYQLERARQEEKGAAISSEKKRERVLGEVARAYLDADYLQRTAGLADRRLESAEKAERLARARVEAGRELPLEAKRAAVETARARQAKADWEAEREAAELELASLLGFPQGDRVRPVGEERSAAVEPATEEEAVKLALSASHELRRIESAVAAQGLAIQSEKAARLPQVDLVAQYGLFARFNNYEDFFRKFQRHNWQVGASVQVPVFAGPAVAARVAQAETAAARLRLELTAAQSRVRLEAQKRFRDISRAEATRQTARMDLDYAREALSVQLALFEEGRALLQQVEEARAAEQVRWMAYHESLHRIEIARLALLEATGQLSAALQ